MQRCLWSLLAISACGLSAAETVTPPLAPGQETSWRFADGDWEMGEHVLTQTRTWRGSRAILLRPAFGDFTLTVDFRVHPEGPGVRAGALILRATGTLSYYWVHLDCKNSQVILVRSGE